jgi:hypothetical protein
MSAPPRICMPTMSGFARQAFRAGLYEGQDVLAACDDVEVVTLEPSARWQGAVNTLRRLAYRGVSRRILQANPGLQPVRLTRDYDMFLVHCNFIEDLWYANAIQGWRERCRTSVCWIDELWVHMLPHLRHWLPILEQFDHVIVGYPGSGPALAAATGRPAHELVFGVDTLRFTPFPRPAERVVDVYSMGRRWEGIHRRLLERSARQGTFYLYDTVGKAAEAPTLNRREHRELYASIAKRSRFFLVAPAKMDVPEETHGQVVIGYRYFEGAAAGSVLIGQAPDSEVFRRLFDWPEAVIEIARDGSDVTEVLARLSAAPDRLRAIGCRNTEQALRRHDWAYRWREVLAMAGLTPRPQLEAREQRLAELAAMAAEHAAVARPA